uniref:Uncharacterized protein n=1 Tax=Mantoniella antarctica TaxID=81844 RepID=A0A7S0SI32_9CHLO
MTPFGWCCAFLVVCVAVWASRTGGQRAGGQQAPQVAATAPATAPLTTGPHGGQSGREVAGREARPNTGGRGTRRITVNVSAFLSESGYIRQEVAASLRELSQRYDVFFLAVCTSVEVREQIRRVFQLHSLMQPWLDRQHRVIFVSTSKGLASAVRQLEPDVHVSQFHELPRS